MNQAQNKYSSELKLQNIYIEEMSFQRNAVIDDNCLSFDFVPEFETTEETVKVKVEGRVSNANQTLEIKIVLVASFECKFDGISVEESEDIKRKNTLAIVFPFLRSQFSIITAQPGLEPITIPPININAYIQDQKNK